MVRTETSKDGIDFKSIKITETMNNIDITLPNFSIRIERGIAKLTIRPIDENYLLCVMPHSKDADKTEITSKTAHIYLDMEY